MTDKELRASGAKEIFDDAYSLYKVAISELEKGKISSNALECLNRVKPINDLSNMRGEF